MVSQTDRKSDGFGIANGSQTIAVTAPDTEAATATEGRTPYKWSPSIHNVTQVTREPVDAWMDEIDFEAEVPCAKRGCNNRADYLVMRRCKHCGWTQTEGHPEPKTQTCCAGHWLRMRSDPTLTWCRCGTHPRPDFFVIVEVLR